MAYHNAEFHKVMNSPITGTSIVNVVEMGTTFSGPKHMGEYGDDVIAPE